MIFISDTEISHSIGYANIPGLTISNVKQIFFENTTFKSNIFNKNQISSIYGVTLFVINSNYLEITN